LTKALLDPLRDATEATAQHANERIEVLALEAAGETAIGFRYARLDDHLEWTTIVVFSRTAADSWVGVRVSCESRHPSVRLPPARKPVVVRTLLSALGGATDGPLTVEGSAHRLGDADVDLAASLMLGTAACRLPVVYASAGFNNTYIVDCDRLASDLAGMAHVVVEPNRPFSLRLKLDVTGENVYGGTIGVYWPDGGGRRSFFLGREFDSADDVRRGVVEEITTALTNRRPLERCTWPYLVENAARQALDALRAEGSQEVDKYIATFDRENAAKDERLAEAEREIHRLKEEVRLHQARLPIGATTLLRSGAEQDLYPNEVVSIVRAALEDAATRVLADSRRNHVLQAVLTANPKSDDRSEELRERLKDLLRGSRSLDAKIRRGLEEIGFSISEEGKHYKLVFRDDDRYTFTLAKSGSDVRAGLNAASQISRLLF
jgi:hypothetical protein